MASPETSKRDGGSRRRRASQSSAGVGLPLDALFEILLRLPAGDICRVRAVCQSWRALASSRLLADAYAALHPGPYIAAPFADGGGGESCGVNIIDLSSGDVVKRIRTSLRDFRLQRTNFDVVCLVERLKPLAVTAMNPANGATCSPAKSISTNHEKYLNSYSATMDTCALGKVPSTGEYKAFRFLRFGSPEQLCEVMTLNGSGISQWRSKPGPHIPVCSSNNMRSVVINGAVYFLYDFMSPFCIYVDKDIQPGSIFPFNLETEEWMGILNGPEPVTRFFREGNVIFASSSSQFVEPLSLTDLNGSLVTVHVVRNSRMDLWFLLGFEKGVKGLWVKKYSIDFPFNMRSAYPLLLLDDERIVFLVQATRVLQCYDPKAGAYTDMSQLGNFRSVGIYTGNLLSLEDAFC